MTLDLRLLVPLGCAWLAAGLLIGLPGLQLPVLVALWLLAAVATAGAFLRSRGWLVVVALGMAAAALCASSVALQSAGRQPTDLVAASGGGRVVTATATASQTLRPGNGSFDVSLTAVGNQPARVPVLVFGEAPDAVVGIGATLTLSGRLEPTAPGDDVSFILFTEGPPEVTHPPPWFLDWANGLRAGFLAASGSLPGSGGDLLAGLAIGDTSAVGDDLDSAMKTSSLSHLTAVSGANCAIVIGLIMLAGRAAGLSRAARIGASILVLLAFVVLVTPEPSVLRAAFMAALVLAALYGGRPVRGVPVLCLAAIALLVFDPWLARNYGFALSVLATGGLLLAAGPLARALGRWLPDWLAMVIAVPLAAQLACQPVLILLDASLPTWGVVANLLAAPAAPIATVVGLAGCLALAVLPPLGMLLCQLAWLPSAWIAAVAQFFATLPGARMPWPPAPLGVGLILLLSALAIFAALSRGARRRWGALALAALLLAYVGVVTGSRVATQVGRPADWQIAMCDVGQGDAVLVRSARAVALIDTGPEPAPLRDCLAELGIDRLDLLVLTHFDLDHVGGVPAVLGRADRVFVGPSGQAGDDGIVASLLRAGATVERVSRGPTGLVGDLRWRILWPPTRLGSIEPGNQSSVSLEFQPVGSCASGCLSSVFLGDLGEQAQAALLAANPLGEVDVVKVSHHGSADQSARLYERLRAVVGIIGVGAGNGYGHPNERLLDLLASVGTVAERTDRHGLILLSPGEEAGTVSVWTEH